MFFEFNSGLFLSVDFIQGEKISHYDENYQAIYKQTLRERKKVCELRRPDLYDNKTKSLQLLDFMVKTI